MFIDYCKDTVHSEHTDASTLNLIHTNKLAYTTKNIKIPSTTRFVTLLLQPNHHIHIRSYIITFQPKYSFLVKNYCWIDPLSYTLNHYE